jgi:hypothetical protein
MLLNKSEFGNGIPLGMSLAVSPFEYESFLRNNLPT